VIQRLRRFALSAAHTRPPQLAARLRLMGKRRLLAGAARLGVRAGPPAPPPALAPAPPRPLFAPRAHLVRAGARGPVLAVLGREWPLETPVAWHDPALDVGTRLELLTLHYMEYLEAVDDARFAALLDDWIAANPPYGRRYWFGNWNSFALSIRVVVWMQQLAARGTRVPAPVAARAARSLAHQLRFLARNLELDIGGNHLVKNLKALLWSARFFAGAEPAAWRATAERLLARELDDQVLPDGVHHERSPAYHAQVFADLLECRHVLDAGAPRDRLDAALAAMAQALVDLTHPDGLPSLFNDGGLHMAYTPAACLAAYAGVPGRPLPPARAVLALPAAGYFGARAGGTLLLADCGPIAPDFLPGHGHGDALAFEWTLDGERLVVDAGVYEYHAGEPRAWSRGTRAHNTVTVDGLDQCEFYDAFRVARRAHPRVERHEARDDGFVLEGSHDGYRHLPGAPVHRRRFDATARRIEVRDEVAGGAGQPVAARLLLHPECSVAPCAGGVTLRRGAAAATLSSATPVRVEEARWFPDFGVCLPTRQLVLDYGTAPCAGGFVLEAADPGAGGEP
jgi:uncharacterized heparinase superfamily protein